MLATFSLDLLACVGGSPVSLVSQRLHSTFVVPLHSLMTKHYELAPASGSARAHPPETGGICGGTILLLKPLSLVQPGLRRPTFS